MKPSLLDAIGQPLSIHSNLVRQGMTSDTALALLTNPDLSFKPKYMSLTQTFREQLKAIANSIDVNINAILKMLTLDQIAEVLDHHKHILWSMPENINSDKMLLQSITLETDGSWLLHFDANSIEFEYSYKLDQLAIEDVLSFLSTIESIIDPTVNRNENSKKHSEAN